ncbi:hypothetical protein ON010_g5491 [Phytophthora cinnamomi]|nr:hypothetical protein ON010_g5491 [Phytophthora cinnamomi]
MHVVESSGVASESTVTESSEMLVTDLDASGFSHRSEESSSNNNTGDPRRSAVVSDGSEAGEYMVTETGAVVRQETSVDPVPEASTGEDSVERESIEAVAAAVVQEVVDGAVAAASAGSVHEPRDRAALVAQSSLQVEISSAEIFHLSFKPQPSPQRVRRPGLRHCGHVRGQEGRGAVPHPAHGRRHGQRKVVCAAAPTLQPIQRDVYEAEGDQASCSRQAPEAASSRRGAVCARSTEQDDDRRAPAAVLLRVAIHR